MVAAVMSVVYVLTTPIPEDGQNATVDQIRRRNKWDNDDYVCRDSLKAKYMAEDASSKNFFVSNFTNYKMTDSRPVMKQYNDLFGILGRFTQHKMNMDEAIQVSCIIDKLPPSWKDFKHTLKHLKEELTLVELGSHLRIEESLRTTEPRVLGLLTLPFPLRAWNCLFLAFFLFFFLNIRIKDEVSYQHSYCFNVEDDPKTFDEAMKSQDVSFWKEAINDEMNSVMGNNTWVLVDLPLSCKPLSCKWIFKRKLKVNGTIKKFKARVVIQGFRQKSEVNYFDTYALVARISTIRLLIAMTSIQNLIIYQMDVKTAFLNGDLDEEAPKQWHQKFDEVVLSNVYLLNQADKCVHIKFDETGKGVIIFLYVDDMLVFGTDHIQVDLTIIVINVLYNGHGGG
ncbi:zinc finger, CCHC-type containing protein [Tanacetum coccineum]